MGADGGYLYVSRSRLQKFLSDAEIDLWTRFIAYNQGKDVYREDLVDVRAWEAENAFDYRYTEGTDVDNKLWLHILDGQSGKEFTNPPEEVWYWKTWMEDNWYTALNERGKLEWELCRGGRYWFNHPGTWYLMPWFPEESTYKTTLPTPDELEMLLSINEKIEREHPYFYLETWT